MLLSLTLFDSESCVLGLFKRSVFLVALHFSIPLSLPDTPSSVTSCCFLFVLVRTCRQPLAARALAVLADVRLCLISWERVGKIIDAWAGANR